MSVKIFLKDSQKDTAHTSKVFTFLIVSEDNINTDLRQKRKLTTTRNADEMSSLLSHINLNYLFLYKLYHQKNAMHGNW